MTLLTITNVHGHHLGHNVCDTEILATLRTYVEFAVQGQNETQKTPPSGDLTSYPMWHNVSLRLNVPEGSDGVLEVLRTTTFVCPLSNFYTSGVYESVFRRVVSMRRSGRSCRPTCTCRPSSWVLARYI